MKMYRKLKRTWSHNDANYIPKFKETFPELKHLSREEMCDRWIKLGVDFYQERKAPVSILLRLTMPLALLFMILMLVGIPINYLITGNWGYSLSKENKLLNWFRAVGLQ